MDPYFTVTFRTKIVLAWDGKFSVWNVYYCNN